MEEVHTITKTFQLENMPVQYVLEYNTNDPSKQVLFCRHIDSQKCYKVHTKKLFWREGNLFGRPIQQINMVDKTHDMERYVEKWDIRSGSEAHSGSSSQLSSSTSSSSQSLTIDEVTSMSASMSSSMIQPPPTDSGQSTTSVALQHSRQSMSSTHSSQTPSPLQTTGRYNV